MPENPRRAIPVLPPVLPPPDCVASTNGLIKLSLSPFSFFLSFSTSLWFLLWQNGGKVVGWWHADGIITAFPFPLKLHSFTNLSPFISDLFIKLTRFHPLSSPSLHFGCLKVKLTPSLSPQSSPYQMLFTKVLLTLSSLGIRVLTSSSRDQLEGKPSAGSTACREKPILLGCEILRNELKGLRAGSTAEGKLISAAK